MRYMLDTLRDMLDALHVELSNLNQVKQPNKRDIHQKSIIHQNLLRVLIFVKINLIYVKRDLLNRTSIPDSPHTPEQS